MTTLDWFKKYGIIVVVVLSIAIFFQTCSSNIRSRKALKIATRTEAKVDSLRASYDNVMILSEEEYRLMDEINRLKTAKQVLYDWNTVVRTVVRPDDRMNYYDTEISKLQKQLDQLRVNKSLNNE